MGKHCRENKFNWPVYPNCGGDQKRWQDAQASVKKKEAYRRREHSLTGGGPGPDISFKPWELKVLQAIPDVAIVGIEGAADTGLDESGKDAESTCAATCSGPGSSCSSFQPVVETEVEIFSDEEETCVMTFDETPILESKKTERKADKRKSVTFEDPTYKALIDLKKKRLEIEERKTVALERIALALENANRHGQDISIFGDCVSPVIKV